ncbi:hypothetical protein FSP39_018570 [Pinctada imbricata]|uniref:Peptidoglycan-recognition protein n=1 Tax=Pinctada imbricata TaxID=66713 RepID=A0AA88YXD4_PINIB|nr:hypothetical protein FSP39_018570 [Pinctada imbricata]
MSGSLQIIPRSAWGARSPKQPPTALSNVPTHVFIHHSASHLALTPAQCAQSVRSFQSYHMDTKGWNDIGYSFVVGEDGNIYEARGWGIQGAHTLGYNNVGIGICVIGNFNDRGPHDDALTATKQLIQYGVVNGKLDRNYTLKGHRDVGNTECPGHALYQIIRTWPHYS